MTHNRQPRFEDIGTIEQLTGCDWLYYKNLIAYSSTKSGGIVLKNIETGN